MKLTGHKTCSVFKRYNVVGEGDLFETAGKLDAKMGSIRAFSIESAKS